jgi:hypothetical protein
MARLETTETLQHPLQTPSSTTTTEEEKSPVFLLTLEPSQRCLMSLRILSLLPTIVQQSILSTQQKERLKVLSMHELEMLYPEWKKMSRITHPGPSTLPLEQETESMSWQHHFASSLIPHGSLEKAPSRQQLSKNEQQEEDEDDDSDNDTMSTLTTMDHEILDTFSDPKQNLFLRSICKKLDTSVDESVCMNKGIVIATRHIYDMVLFFGEYYQGLLKQQSPMSTGMDVSVYCFQEMVQVYIVPVHGDGKEWCRDMRIKVMDRIWQQSGQNAADWGVVSDEHSLLVKQVVKRWDYRWRREDAIVQFALIRDRASLSLLECSSLMRYPQCTWHPTSLSALGVSAVDGESRVWIRRTWSLELCLV